MSLDAALDTIAPKPAPPPGRPAVNRPPTEQLSGHVNLRVDQIAPNPENPRERLTEITELADSIREAGLIQPLIVRPGPDAERYVIVAGHRRYEAVKRLGWLHVEAIVRREMRAVDDLVTALIENGQRAGLDPIEEARALHALKVRDGLTDAQIAKRVGRSQPVVSGRIALLALSHAEQEELRAGQMRVGEAVHLARTNSGTKVKGGDHRGWHLTPAHPLASRAKVRCQQQGHKAGRGIGGVGACGECWEQVIRIDERQEIYREAATSSQCPICDGPYGVPTAHQDAQEDRA